MSGSHEPLGTHASPDNVSNDISRGNTVAQSVLLQNPSHHGEVLDEPSPPTRSGNRKTRFSDFWQALKGKLSQYWAWELLASGFSMTCTATIVIVLPVRRWQAARSRWSPYIPLTLCIFHCGTRKVIVHGGTRRADWAAALDTHCHEPRRP